MLNPDDPRPTIKVLMALPSLLNVAIPKYLVVVDLFDVPLRRRAGFVFVAVDPADEIEFRAWCERHPFGA